MCLIRVKEEDDYSVPARVVRREQRRRSPPRTTRVSRAYYEEPRRPVEPTYIIQQPSPPPSPPAAVVIAHPPPPPPPSHHGSRAQYVEVSPDSDASGSSSDSDVRSKTTSRSKSTLPQSEYQWREKEYLRERNYDSPHRAPPRDHSPRRDDYDTYRYVQPPGEPSRRRSDSLGARGGHADDPRASRTSYKRERLVVVDNEGRRTREYQR